MGHGKNELKRIMKKIVCFCAVAFAMVMPAGVYASNVSLLGNPPQQGTTTVHESCYTQGVSYKRENGGGSSQSVTVTRPNNSDVNVNVTRSNGTSYSNDTRSGWGVSAETDGTTTHSTGVTQQDNVEIRCYQRDQK